MIVDANLVEGFRLGVPVGFIIGVVLGVLTYYLYLKR